jgi:acyl-[acyl-carrier-protein]-phospholipid O-acyltransferase/long-chain-fatty-acid--[acyl-carrier-protein] ligase
MLKFLIRWLVRLLFGFRAYNEAAARTAGPVLLLPNHVSWWDWVLIGVCLEDDWRFVTSSATAKLSWVHRRIMVNRRTFPVDMNSPYAVKHMAEYLQRGGRLVLFPEGRLSRTGSLMKLFDGTGFLLARTRAKVITAYMRGAYRLPFSPNPNRKQWFPRVSVHFSSVLTPPDPGHSGVAGARMRLTDWLRDQMVRQRFATEMELGPRTLPEAIAAAARQRRRQVIVQDATMARLTYRKLLLGARVLATQWGGRFGPQQTRVGVLLPNVNAMPLVILSLWQAGRVPAVLNYATGPAILLACARLAGLKHIITARSFVERAKLDPEPLRAAGIELIFLEDVRAGVAAFDKFRAALGPLFSSPATRPASHSDDTALILFTSGSEGDPKGVELTHRNLLANIRQMLAVIDLMDTDRFFNALPLFHSFGLTVGLLLPLTTGSFVFLYLSPLHYRVVPSAFYNLDCTAFFGTNTFLAGYARKAHPYDFRALRYLFAGAEKLHESTSALWMQKFGVRILEGYGVTECSPCLTVNVPLRPRHGSAGRFLPEIEYRLEPVEGIGEGDERQVTGDGTQKTMVRNPEASRLPSEINPSTTPPSTVCHPSSTLHTALSGPSSSSATRHSSPSVGRLFVRGPNVMRGYLNAEANAKFRALDGWYDTGDIARVDADGFVYIRGRLKRFAKISGEMVSLTAVEEALANAFTQYGLRFAIAVLSKPDATKGEKLVAVTNEPKLTLDAVREALRARGLGNLSFPRELKLMRELPRLGSGKVNHRELERMMEEVKRET